MAKRRQKSPARKQGKAKPEAAETADDDDAGKQMHAVSLSSHEASDDSDSSLGTGSRSGHKTNTSANANAIVDDVDMEEEQEQTQLVGSSRLFSPFRTLGVVSDGAFHLIPNQNSSNALAVVPIGERFQILRCNRLHPVLVSQAVPASEGSTRPQRISHLISDEALNVALVAHGSVYTSEQVTLFKRTKPIASMKLTPSSPSSDSSSSDGGDWEIVNLLHLGRIKMKMTGEKEGKKENVVFCAAILAKTVPDDGDDGVPVLGDSDDEGSDDSDDDSDDNSSTESKPKKCLGQIVLLLASRTSLTVYKRIELSDDPTFQPRCAVHPSTYVNKILIGGVDQQTKQPSMVLINVKTGKLLHTFSCIPKSQYERSEVSTLEQSPAIDTIAVGTSTGSVHLINARHDKLLFSVHHKSKDSSAVRVTSVSFRTDAAALQYGVAPMAVGRADGTISIWDLTPPEHDSLGRSLLHEMENVHYPGGVAKLQYMPQEPVLVSTGTKSNAFLMHIFDNPDHSATLLRQRKGHTSAPRNIRYLHSASGVLANTGDGTDAAVCQILSSGGDDRTFRLFSTARSVLDKEYSQGAGLEKRAKQFGLKSKTDLLLPRLSAMTMAEARSRDWGDIVTIHENHAFAYVWSSKRGAQSGPVLRQSKWQVSAMKKPLPDYTHATSVAISACGNFAVVGTKGGKIYKYNIQSGHPRGSYPRQDGDDEDEEQRKRDARIAGNLGRTMKMLEKEMKISQRPANMDKFEQDAVTKAKLQKRRDAKLKMACHDGHSVTGLAVDSINKTLISVGADAKLILWNFANHGPHKKSPYMLPAPATKMSHVRDSNLAAITLQDRTAVLFDCSDLTIVRRFGKTDLSSMHKAPITDVGFSPDGRTLYTSSLDSTIRVWDVPTNVCIDWLAFQSPPTSLTVSPTGEFLATTHAGKIGISLWSDRSFYETVHLDGGQSIKSAAKMNDPIPISEDKEDGDDEEDVFALTAAAAKNGSTLSRSKLAKSQADEEETEAFPVPPKRSGLITLSGLPPAHWKNLFHLELVKQRNKPKEAPKKPPSAPFFLQWRPGTEDTKPTTSSATAATPGVDAAANNNDDDDDAWNAAWSDDDDENNDVGIADDAMMTSDKDNGNTDDDAEITAKRSLDMDASAQPKKRRIAHHRSHLAALLQQCEMSTAATATGTKTNHQFQEVSDYIATLGPSAIDVALSTLCNGMHDLEDGIPLLLLASSWLLEAVRSRERFEAVNAYLHRFLHLHASVIAGVDAFAKMDGKTQIGEESAPKPSDVAEREELLQKITELRHVQKESAELLYEKMQSSLCLLRHFSRMV